MIIKSRLSIIISFLIFFSIRIDAQDVGIGEWRDHLPYNSTISVTSTGDRVYCATNYSVFYYNKKDNSLNRLSRVTGLSDIGIAKIAYNKADDALVIAYSNTNIDIIKGNLIINMADVFNSSAITPQEKKVNNITFKGTIAYLSCGFGIVALDIDKEEVKDTYYIGPNGSHLNVFDLTFGDNDFFAATENGIYTAAIDNPNLAFFGSWTKDQSLPYPDAEYNLITWYKGMVFANKYTPEYAGDTIFYLKDNQWQTDTDIFTNHNDVYGMRVTNDELYVIQRYSVTSYNQNLEVTKLVYTYFTTNCAPRDAIVDNDGLWIADDIEGLVHEESYQKFVMLYPNGPKSVSVYDMDMQGQDLWVVPGGRNLGWGNVWYRAELFAMTGGLWQTIDRDSPGSEGLDSLRDLVCVAINPFNKSQVFAGAWSLGLAEIDNKVFTTLYTPQNSSLEYKANEGPPICKIGGVAFDPNGNMWVTNSGANNILSVRINNGTSEPDWRSFYLGSQSTGKDIGDLIIDSYGQKWILWRQGFLIVFSDNNTPKNPADDKVKHLSNAQGNGGIPGNDVFSIAEDKDGEMWIGTDEGIAVIYSPENVFSQYDFDAQQILIPRNDGTGLADILLEFETITAIAVDGANNKWIGTDRSGVYEVSPDGLEEIHHFTTENSPLLSNNIRSIAINQESGEVFFGTGNGIISYKSMATGGGETNSDVYAYPNPVRPGYNGPVAIKGLVSNADFKITDISGSLVFSGRAEGGQAVWPGTNFNGRRVQSGVYLVFITDERGTEKMVTKILFMN